MSYDVALRMPESAACTECGCTCQVDGADSVREFRWNYTYNIAPMAREAGFRIRDFDGKRAGDVAAQLEPAISLMQAEPERFIAFNAENGWGTYDNFVPALLCLLRALKRWPDAIVEVS